MFLHLAHFAILISNVMYIPIHKQVVVFEIALTFSFGFARQGVRSYFLTSGLYCSQHVACEV